VISSRSKSGHKGNIKVGRDGIDLLSQKGRKDGEEVFLFYHLQAVHVK
jgi:hypothetical protein